MRSTRKRALALTAGLAGISLVLTGCGGSTTDDESPAAAGDGETQAPSDEEITLTVATFNEFGYAELYEEYMADNPNVKIEEVKAATSNEARDKLNTSLAAGSRRFSLWLQQ